VADSGCQARVVGVGMGKQDSLDVARNGTTACEMVAKRAPVGRRGEGCLLHDDSHGPNRLGSRED